MDVQRSQLILPRQLQPGPTLHSLEGVVAPSSNGAGHIRTPEQEKDMEVNELLQWGVITLNAINVAILAARSR